MLNFVYSFELVKPVRKHFNKDDKNENCLNSAYRETFKTESNNG